MSWGISTILYMSQAQKEGAAFKTCWEPVSWLLSIPSPGELAVLPPKLGAWMGLFYLCRVLHTRVGSISLGVMQKIARGALELGHVKELPWISQFAAALWLCLSGCVIKLLSVLSDQAKRVYLPHSLLCTKLIHMAGNFLVLRPRFDPAAMEKAILSPADQGCLHSGTGN